MTETMDPDLYRKYKKAATIINGAGGTPLRVGDTLIKILRHILPDEEALSYVKYFKAKTTQTMEQLIETSGLTEEELLPNLNKLAKVGLIFNQPNRHGVVVYRLMPFIDVGVFEYTFMGKLEDNEANRELAQLYHELTSGLKDLLKNNYKAVEAFVKRRAPVDRTIPLIKLLEMKLK